MLRENIRKVAGVAVISSIATIYAIAPLAAEPPPVVAVLTGAPAVRDGDGLLFGRVEIRLQGIAAPEDGRRHKDPGGRESTDHLRQMIEGRDIECHLDGTTAASGNRPVAVCYLDGDDLGRLQIEAGHARDCPRYSGGRYSEAERKAVVSGRNLSLIYQLPPYC